MPNHEENLTRRLLLPELKLLKYEWNQWWMRLFVKKTSEFEVCPKCASKCYGAHDKRESIIRDAPLRNKNVELYVEKRRFRCLKCRHVFTEPIPGVYRGRRTTERFRAALCEAAENYVSLARVKKKYRCSSYLIYKVLYEQLELKRRTRLYPWPKTIGIDENRFGKNSFKFTRFSTVIRDFKNKRLFELVDGREASVLRAALWEIPGRENVTHVAMDLCSPYRSFVKGFFPNAQIVADHFHVVRLLHPHINRIRKQYVDDVRNPIRKLLLRNGTKLDYFKRGLIWKWLEDKATLREIYFYKEALHKLYNTKGYGRAKRALFKMTDQMGDSTIAEIKTLRRTLLNWKWEILNYFKTGITNAATEGTNNKLKLLKKQAYGYKNFNNYRLRALNACA